MDIVHTIADVGLTLLFVVLCAIVVIWVGDNLK